VQLVSSTEHAQQIADAQFLGLADFSGQLHDPLETAALDEKPDHHHIDTSLAPLGWR
jgi:hypothetical protein